MTTPARSSFPRPLRVWLARRVGGAWGGYEDAGILLPLVIQESIAPKFARAEVLLNSPGLKSYPWRWRDWLAFDDRVLITNYALDEEVLQVFFEGFVNEIDWSFAASDIAVKLVAFSNAYRLFRDVVVYGRWMMCNDAKVRHFSALKCAFNAGGKPNRWPEPVNGLPCFCGDDDKEAEYWSAVDVFHYLQGYYNNEQAWIANKTFTAEEHDLSGTIDLDVDGMNLWEALAAVGDKAGYDVYETFDGSAGSAEAPANSSAIAIVSRVEGPGRTAGTLVAVKHQAPPEFGLGQLDPSRTNVFSLSLAESVTSSIAAPVVAGGAQLLEITVELLKAWDPTKLEVPEGEEATPTAFGLDKEDVYYRHYCTDGPEFRDYADVGRLWDANTDGKYDDDPWNLSYVDLAALIEEDEPNSWPAMAHKPLPCLTKLAKIGEEIKIGISGESFAEYSTDGGTIWYPLAGYKVLSDRIGLRIDQANLADIYPPESVDPVSENLFACLHASPGQVKVRLTCTISAPQRNIAAPARRAGAGTIFPTAAFYDRGAYAQRRTVQHHSRFAFDEWPADEVTVEEAEALINEQAEAVQDLCEDRLIEGTLPIEWPDEPIALSNRIQRIDGIGVDLGTNTGPARRWPRVVGRSLHLTAETWNMVLALETDRRTGMV